MDYQRISLPRGPGSLSQLTQSATHVLRVDRSGPALLIDVSGKKPVAHELPMTIIAGKGSEPDTGLTIISGGFSPDGQRLVLLRDGTDQKGGRLPQVELVDVQTRALVSSFPLKKVKGAYGVKMHPDGQQLFVWGSPETFVFSLDGKELKLKRWGTPRSFSYSPKATQACIELEHGEFMLRPMDKLPKSPPKFEASEVVWLDEETLVAATWLSQEKSAINLVDAKTGKLKKVATIPSVSALDAHSGWAFATNVQGKKVLVTAVELKSGKTQKFELVGSPSGTAVSAGPAGAYVAVNWQKVLHVLSRDGGAAKKPAPAPAREKADESAQDGDFVRYEMAQKFWAVKLEGGSFTVRFGKQGTDGQEQVKSFADAALAQKEHDKLVASKVKKGYRAV